jgi:RNA polymerase sigma factor for flagellar operon FliA
MAESRDRLVEENLELVDLVASRLKRQFTLSMSMDDLRAYGVQGLLEAADRFDASRGTSFSGFAYYRVRGSILDGMRKSGWYSRGDYTRYRAEERANEYLRSLADRSIEGAPAAAPSEQILEDIASVLDGIATVHVASLGEADESELSDERLPAADDALGEKELRSKVRKAVATLPKSERRLMELYYFEDKNLAEAGEVMGLSKSWVCRLHARAINLLRDALATLAEC